MTIGIENNIARVVTRTVLGSTFAVVALEQAIDDTLRKGTEVAQEYIMTDVYMRGQGEGTRYQRTYTLYHSVKGSKFFATGGQIFLQKRDFKKKYYPPFVDRGTRWMEGRDFWKPTTEVLKAIVKANMLIAAERTAQMMGEGF